MLEAPSGASRAPALVLPVAVEASGPSPAQRDIAAITYAANPVKKGLARVLEAWRRLHGETRGSGSSWWRARAPMSSREPA